MEAMLSKRNVNCYKKVYSACFSREETAESVVPDVLPDIAEIIDADGFVTLKSKEVEIGRVNITGNVSACVLYLPEGGGSVKKLAVTVPLSVSTDAPSVNENCKAVVRLRVVSADARMLNPRKVLMRVDVCVEIFCYEECEFPVCDAIGEEHRESIHALTKTCRVSPVTGVKEKTFVLTDEYMIPAMKPAMVELLKQRVEIYVDDVKPVGNKVIFKGAAEVSLLYLGDIDGEPASVSFTTAFSQILEMDGENEQPDSRIIVMLTGAYFESMASSDNRAMSMELHVVAQAVMSGNEEITYLADAYSNELEVRLESGVTEMPSMERRVTARETIREICDTPSPVRELIHVYPMPGAAFTAQGGAVSCPITMRAVIRNDAGLIESVTKRFTLETSVEIEAEMEVSVLDVRCAEVYAQPAAGGFELRMPVDVDIMVSATKRISCVSAIELEEVEAGGAKLYPSVTALRPGTSMSVWELAKRYRSTPELIMDANELTEGEALGNKLLIIPRAR